MGLIRQMTALKQYAAKRPEFKVLVLFNSVLDCLFFNEERTTVKKAETEHSVTAAQYEAFCVDLTITYEFDYIELITPLEVIEFLKEMHLSIKDKPTARSSACTRGKASGRAQSAARRRLRGPAHRLLLLVAHGHPRRQREQG